MTIRAIGIDDGRPWYAVRDYPTHVRDVDIEISAAGAHFAAHLGIDPGSRRLAWLTRHWSGVAVILTPWRAPSAEAPPARYPTTWRPYPDVAFPAALPTPLAKPRPRAPLTPDEAPPPPAEGDGWPHPEIALGLGAPASLAECEARVLRALRSVEAGPRVGHVVRRTSGDYASEWHAILRRFEDHDATDPSHIGPVRALFTPTRRDLADAEAALGWLFATCDADEVYVFRCRAADPAYSFAQIAERQGRWRRRSGVHAAYLAALARIFVVAQATQLEAASS
ncbi:MAG: hypothetical protein RI936_29 [Pseudomonadota bacterium]|jgi:hypothetical protein